MPILLLLTTVLFFSLPGESKAADFVEIAAGGNIICALKSDGGVDCRTHVFASRLAPPDNLPPLTTIVAGDVHVCGLTLDGTATCWGDNSFGQLDAPSDVQFTSLSAGTNISCGITLNNQARCWGLNTKGEGDPPQDVQFVQIANDRNTSCGITTEGSMQCWGQFPDLALLGPDVPLAKLVVQRNTVCGLTTEGTIQCRFPGQDPDGGRFIDIARSRYIYCGLQDNGDLSCTTNEGTPSWVEFLARRTAEINAGPALVSISGSVWFDRKICGLDINSEVHCIQDRVPPTDVPGGDITADSIPSVINLRGDIYSDTTIELFWQLGPNSGFVVGGSEIYRDGVLLDSVSNSRSYIDRTLTPGVDYQYSVAVRNLDGTVGPQSTPIVLNTVNKPGGGNSGYVVVERPFEPSGLSASVYSSTTVELMWNRLPFQTSAFAGYEIRRDQEFLDFTTGVSFIDRSVMPGNRYHYDVVAVGPDGRILGFRGLEVSIP